MFACLHERSSEGILFVHGKCYLTLPCFFVPVTISELPQYGRMAKCSRETTLIHHTGCLFFMTLGPLASFFIFLFKSVAYDGQLLFLFCLLSSPWVVCSPVVDQFVRKREGKRKKKKKNYVSSLPHLPPAMESKKITKKEQQFVHQKDVLISWLLYITKVSW